MGALNNLIPFSLIFWGQTQIASGLATILNATTPLFTLVVAHLLTHDERMNGAKVAVAGHTTASAAGPRTLFDKVWDRHVVVDFGDGSALLHVDRHLVHDLGGGPAYAETAAASGMTEGAVKVAVHRLRQRYNDLLREEIAQTVASPHEIADEHRHLTSTIRR